jgi:high-affinity iron transporter
MLASYLIGLREGLEATLVVSILIAFLARTGRRGLLRLVWAGVAGAIVCAVAFGALLTYTSATLDEDDRELFDAVTSIAAVVFVTWMIFWMRRMARRISGDLRSRLEHAIEVGPVAIVAMAFLAVAREGLETALLFFSAVQGATTSAGPLLAISGGLLTAVVLGWLLYTSVMRVNLGRFFAWTGVLLALVAAGILKYGVHDLQEGGVLPGLNTPAFDISAALPPDAWYSTVLSGMFNITARPSVLETIAWAGYAVVVLALFLRPGHGPARPVRAQQPENAERPDASPVRSG